MGSPFDESLTVLSCSIKKNLMLEFSDAGSLGASKEAALRFKVVAYYPLQFAELRRRFVVGGELAFVLSLSRCKRWHPRGGKTTAYFAKTHDERFVVKQLSRPEKVCCCTAPTCDLCVLLQTHGQPPFLWQDTAAQHLLWFCGCPGKY
jgi:hypothetical protein